MRNNRSTILAALIILLLGNPIISNAQDAEPGPDKSEQDDQQLANAAASDSSSAGPVYIVPISGMIDKGLALYVDRAISEAEASGSAVIVFHTDTFGGLVDAADQIRQAILDTRLKTVAFIEHNAASAGALISYASDTILMAPGSSIGAATVVEGPGGEAAPDKYQSYMRGLMRSTAEANGRDPRIAEAMVDEDIEIEGISEKGSVLTLSTREALNLGVADAEVADLEAALEWLGISDNTVVRHETSQVERILRFFGSPVMQSILMLMMLGGLYFELQTPGVGFAGIMAAIGAAMFFGPHYMLGLAESWEIVLFVVGIVLILIEIFVLPGFGIAGVTGLILLVFSLGVSLIGNVWFSFPTGPAIASAVWTLAITMLLLVALLISLGKYMPRSQRFGQLVLASELSSSLGYTAAETRDDLLGVTGETLTALRPSGMAMLNDQRVDVVTSGEYIPAGEIVLVMSVNDGRVQVRMANRTA